MGVYSILDVAYKREMSILSDPNIMAILRIISIINIVQTYMVFLHTWFFICEVVYCCFLSVFSGETIVFSNTLVSVGEILLVVYPSNLEACKFGKGVTREHFHVSSPSDSGVY